MFSSRRDLREKGWRMWVSRGDNAGEHDNKPVITEILKLRAERAKLLGFPSHAHWIIDDNMAKTPEAAMALSMKVWKAAVARVREEVADMQKVADAEKAGIKIEPWDYRYYAEKVRKAKYDLDQNEVKPYLQLEKLREAMFWASGQLYGFAFTQVKDVPVYQPDVRVYEVKRDGKHLGLWYFDPYARDGKQSGAWMNEYRTQESFRDHIDPVVSNNSNFVKGKKGEPILISWDDATTMFHEFGHALHGLNSNVRFPSLAGTNTKRDFVEFPSQLNEHWLSTPEVLNTYAVHYKTGKPMPKELFDKIEKAQQLQQGVLDRRVPRRGDLRPQDPHARARQGGLDRSGRLREAHDEGDRDADRDRDASPPHAVRSHLQRRRLLGRLLLVHLGRHADRGCGRGVRRGGELLRQGDREAALRVDHERRQLDPARGRVQEVPRPRCRHQRADARPRLPGHEVARVTV